MQRVEVWAAIAAVVGLLSGLAVRRYGRNRDDTGQRARRVRVIQASSLLVCAAFLSYAAFADSPHLGYLDLGTAVAAAVFGVVELRKGIRREIRTEGT